MGLRRVGPGRLGGDAHPGVEAGRGASRKGAGRPCWVTGVCERHLDPSTHGFRCPHFPERTWPCVPPGEWGDQSLPPPLGSPQGKKAETRVVREAEGSRVRRLPWTSGWDVWRRKE